MQFKVTPCALRVCTLVFIKLSGYTVLSFRFVLLFHIFIGSSKTIVSESTKFVDAFKSQRDVLADVLQYHLPDVASKLYTKSIISAAVLAEAMNQVHMASVRTVSLLSVVEDKIRAKPHVFTEFVRILESEPTLRSLAKELYDKGMRLLLHDWEGCMGEYSVLYRLVVLTRAQ